MKKLLIGVLALSTAVMASETESTKPSKFDEIINKIDVNKMYITPKLGMDLLSKYDHNLLGISNKTDGFGGGIGLDLYQSINKNLDVGIGFAYQNHADRKEHHEGTYYGNLSGLEYQSLPVYVTGKYNFDTKFNFKPHLKVDLGFSINFGISDLESSELGNDDDVDINSGLYSSLGGGFDYKRFNFDIMYTINRGKIESGGLKAKNNYKRFELSVGYKFDCKNLVKNLEKKEEQKKN